MYQVPQHINENKVFFINRSAIDNRLDAQYYSANLDLAGFVKLSSVAIVKGGKRIPKGYGYSDEATPYHYLRVADMDSDSQVDVNNLTNISKNVFDILERYEITAGELAISIAGTIGKTAILKDIPNGKRVILTENCAKILVKHDSELLSEYLKICLELPIVKKQLDLNYIQTTIPKLGLDKIVGIKIPPIPCIQKQQEIVEYINTAYAQKQAKEEEAQQLLDSIDDYLLKELGITMPNINAELTDRIFYVNYSDLSNRLDPYYSLKYFQKSFEAVHSGKYPVVSLRSLSTLITSGITPKSGGDAYVDDRLNGIPFIRSGNINIDGELDFNDLLYIRPDVHKTIMKSSQVRKNDLMIAIVGATIGQVGIYVFDNEANINQAIALVRLKDGINVEYVKELIKSSIGQLSLNRLKRPVARANINLEEIATIQVVLPPYEIQQKIANQIQCIRRQAKALQAEGKTILEDAKRKVEQMIIRP